MRLRDWPPRRIGRMWLIGIAVQVAAFIVVPMLLGWEFSPGPDPAMYIAPVAALDTTSAAADTSAPPPVTMTRTVIAPGDTVIRIERGASYLSFRTTGGKVEMSPDVEKGARSLGDALGRMLDEVVAVFLTMLAILLIPPLILGAITLAWTFQRRRRAAI